MGYELKLYIVEPSLCDSGSDFMRRKSDDKYAKVYRMGLENQVAYEDNGNDEAEVYGDPVKRSYSPVLAMVDLSKPGYESSILNVKRAETSSYFYGSDGNTAIIEDRYGEFLTECPLSDAIAALESDSKENPYRRYSSALQCLKAFDGPVYENIKVLFFGY